MKNITVQLYNGDLKYTWDGHYYNGHVLDKVVTTSINPNSGERREVEVTCAMCEESYKKRIATHELWRVDLLYVWMVGQFDQSCPFPHNDVAKAAKKTWKKHKGDVLTNSVRMEMKEDIQSVCNEPLQVSFE